MAGKIQHLIGGLGQFIRFANLLDKTIPDEKTSIRYLAAEVIHSNQNRSIFDEERLRHGKTNLVWFSLAGKMN
jgi:hypothetical protein